MSLDVLEKGSVKHEITNGVATVTFYHPLSNSLPGKLLNDSALVELAMNPPTNKREFDKVLRPIGLRARWKENLDIWLTAISSAVALPESRG